MDTQPKDQQQQPPVPADRAKPKAPPPQHEPRTVHEEIHSELHFSPARTVCIAIDGSKSSEHAIAWALANVLRPDTDQVVLLHVRPFVTLPTLSYGAPFIDYGVWDVDAFAEIEEANKRASHELLIAAAKSIKKAGLHVRAIALRGDAREELVYKIEDLKADLVVMGSRGLSSFGRAFMGSVSDHLTHNVKCPVIVTRQNA